MVNIPPGAIVPVQQDPYSPTLLMSVEDAHELQNAARLGGSYKRRHNSHKKQKKQKIQKTRKINRRKTNKRK